jgi:hypothetical protein
MRHIRANEALALSSLVPQKMSSRTHFVNNYEYFVLSLKIGISWLSSECGNNDFPHGVFFTLQQKLEEIALYGWYLIT